MIGTRFSHYSHFVGNNNQDEPRVGNPIFQVDSGSCEPECNSDGSCKMTFYPNNGGFKSGSCVSKAFGGNCLGYPTQCGGSSCHSVCGGSSGRSRKAFKILLKVWNFPKV